MISGQYPQKSDQYAFHTGLFTHAAHNRRMSVSDVFIRCTVWVGGGAWVEGFQQLRNDHCFWCQYCMLWMLCQWSNRKECIRKQRRVWNSYTMHEDLTVERKQQHLRSVSKDLCSLNRYGSTRGEISSTRTTATALLFKICIINSCHCFSKQFKL